MKKHFGVGIGCLCALILAGCTLGTGRGGAQEESERAVTEAEVPRAALDALQLLAAGARITEFAEEIEHGSKLYEGSWAGAVGHVDALVTEAGATVEIEEAVSASEVPAAVRAEAERRAGMGAKLSFERKTTILYEIHFEKNGKEGEVVLAPDGRVLRESGGEGGSENGGK